MITKNTSLKKKKYGLDKVMYEIEELFLNSRYLHNKMYLPWILLSSYDKYSFKKQIRDIIRKELLGEEFLLALSRDILKDGYIEIESEVYKYVKNRMYRGNVRKMLGELKSILDRRK